MSTISVYRSEVIPASASDATNIVLTDLSTIASTFVLEAIVDNLDGSLAPTQPGAGKQLLLNYAVSSTILSTGVAVAALDGITNVLELNLFADSGVKRVYVTSPISKIGAFLYTWLSHETLNEAVTLTVNVNEIVCSVGATGATGATGAQGPDGAQGADGAGLSIKGTLAGIGELPVDAAVNDGYLIDGDLYIWDGATWDNVGQVQGPTGPQGVSIFWRGAYQAGTAYDVNDLVSYLGSSYINKVGSSGVLPTQAATWDLVASIGLQGATGEKGDTGLQGEIGPTGAQGETGLTGDQGLQGDTGLTGAQGPEGPQGPQGLQGIQGPQGVQGDRGIQGETGATGAQGTAGTSVTILGTLPDIGSLPASGNPGDGYLIDGNLYIWNGIDWTNVGTIQGPQGIQGETGLQGIQGTPGIPGAQGLQGIQGETGAQGPIGATGATGATGAQGPEGPASTALAIADDTATNSTWYPVLSPAASGTQAAKTSSSKLNFNPSTGVLQVAGLVVGDNTNNTTFAADGSMTANGSATYWDDVYISTGVMSLSLNDAPSWERVQYDGTGAVTAVEFDTAVQYGTLTAYSAWTNALQGNVAYTVEFWVRPDSASTPFATALGLTTKMEFGYRCDQGSIYPYYKLNTTAAVAGTTRLNYSGWNHLVFCRSGTTMTYYANGVVQLVGTAASVTSLGNFVIGALTTAGVQPLLGSLSKLTVYSVVLTAAQVAQRYNGGAGSDALPTGITEASQVAARFRFLEGTGTLLDNAATAGAGNDITLVGTPTWEVGPVGASGNRGVYLLSFDGGRDLSTSFTLTLPHGAKESVAQVFYPHLHFVAEKTIAVGETIIFELEYSYSPIYSINGSSVVNAAGVFPNTTVELITFTAGVAIPALAHVLVELGTWTVNNTGVSPEWLVRIGRKGTLGTYANDIFLLSFGIHYEIDTPGSHVIYH